MQPDVIIRDPKAPATRDEPVKEPASEPIEDDPPTIKSPPAQEPGEKLPPLEDPPPEPNEPGQPPPIIEDPPAPDANPIDPRVF